MTDNHTPTVFVVQVDNSKNMEDARRFGELRAVFANPRKPYDTARMIGLARRVLSEWRHGDHLLMVGDPALCAVCMNVLGEQVDEISILSWDRNTFRYREQCWDFTPDTAGEFDPADAG